jgi:hypothetical protein
MFKTHFGIAQGYEEDIETQIEAYEYVIEIEHNKEDDMLNIEEFKRFDDILHAIVQQSNGTLIIDEQAYNSFKDQVLNSGKYETSLTAYGQEKLNEVIEPMLSENSCEDDSIDLFDMPVYEKEEKQCTMYDETCEPEPCDIPEEVEIGEIVEEETQNEIDEESQKVIDAINSDEPEVFDYSYDFIPEEKGNQVIEYIEGESGKFERAEKATESIASIISGIDSNPLYMQILNVFFLDGQRKVGDIIPPYEVFLKDIKNRGIECPDKIVKNFLTVCNLLGIVNMADEKKVTIMKDYESSKQIISLVSK